MVTLLLVLALVCFLLAAIQIPSPRVGLVPLGLFLWVLSLLLAGSRLLAR